MGGGKNRGLRGRPLIENGWEVRTGPYVEKGSLELK